MKTIYRNIFVPAVAIAFLTSNNAAVITYTRDTAGRLQSVNYANGNSHTYGYDANGNLLQRAGVLAGSANPDSDGDGLDDAWEQLYFGNLTRDGSADSDNDGMTDRAEFLAGSNPTDIQSALRLFRNPARVGSSVTVQWVSVAGKHYRLQFKDTLNQIGWTDVPGDVTASASTASASDNTAVNATRFYRVILVE